MNIRTAKRKQGGYEKIEELMISKGLHTKNRIEIGTDTWKCVLDKEEKNFDNGGKTRILEKQDKGRKLVYKKGEMEKKDLGK